MGNEGRTWESNEHTKAVTAAALEQIDRAQEGFPKCRACGQRTKPSREGFCTRQTEEHDRLKNEARWRA